MADIPQLLEIAKYAVLEAGKVIMEVYKSGEFATEIKPGETPFMSLLENLADIYPRLGSTMEWDTAAAHTILNTSNSEVYQANLKSELRYNKHELENPFFIAF